MIIVKLIGGLGNQMFQYAAGRRLAYKYNTELKLDIRGFKNYTLRNYSLNNFNIVENFVTSSDLSRVLIYSDKTAIKVFKHIRRIVSEVQLIEYVKEKEFSVQPNILNLSDNVYLDGYWQSEKYFLEIEDTIRQEFNILNPLTSTSQEIAEQIKNCESVSIHVRRGDYVLNPKTNSILGVCGLEYYHMAINIINEKIDNPHFFIFSDDHEWTCSNIKPDESTTYVRHNDCSKDYEDMCLMSMCKHHIIANSSFSWWGAWLSHNKNKIVIAPAKWFQNQDYNGKCSLPPKWIRV